MPTYVYECVICGMQVEKIQKITEDKLDLCCESCNNQMTRIISSPGLILKGVGLYKPTIGGDE